MYESFCSHLIAQSFSNLIVRFLSASYSSNGTILTFVRAYDNGSKSSHCNLAVDALFGELLHKLPIRIVIGL